LTKKRLFFKNNQSILKMTKILLTILFSIASFTTVFTQEISQPTCGPGGSEYAHDTVNFQSYAEEADGYYLFEPQQPQPDSAPIIVFFHGYGAYNPMAYGQWIQHLVRKGSTVIFPRYQESMLSPLPSGYADNCAIAIKDALKKLSTGDHVRAKKGNLSFVGHSFGGAILANLAVNYKAFGIPKPAVAMLCSPGTGFVSMGRLDSYEEMPADIKLLVTVSENDKIVGDEFALRVFNEAKHVPDKNFIRQFRDKNGDEYVSAQHNEVYCLLMDYDSGHRSPSARRSMRISKTNAMDYYGYWKWFDALLECSRSGNYCEYALGNTPEQRSLGCWNDGTAIKEVEVLTK
jgi:acetyl esterase/lipase